MGIYVCKEQSHLYECINEGQGAIYLGLTMIYIGLEIHCIIETIKICKTQKDVKNNYVLIAAHSCIHILFIRDILTLPGGVLICYPRHLYEFMATYLYILKHLILLTMLYQIVCILLDSYTIPARKRFFKKVIIGIGVVDFTVYTSLYIISNVLEIGGDSMSTVVDVFCILDALVIGCVFCYFLHYFKKLLKRMEKFVPGGKDARATMFLEISVICCFLARIIDKIIHFNGSPSFIDSILYGVYMAVYYAFNEIFPCIMIFHTMKKGGKEHYMKLDIMFKINKKSDNKK